MKDQDKARYFGQEEVGEFDISQVQGNSPNQLDTVLQTVDERTEGEWLEGEIIGSRWKETNVNLFIAIPHNHIIAFELEIPRPYTREFHLKRLMDHYGLEAGEFDELIGKDVKVKRRFKPPGYEPTGIFSDHLNSMASDSSDISDYYPDMFPGQHEERVRVKDEFDFEPGTDWQLYDPMTFREEFKEYALGDNGWKALRLSSFYVAPVFIAAGALIAGGSLLLAGLLFTAMATSALVVNHTLSP